MSLSSNRRTSFFLAALAAASTFAGCTYDGSGEPIVSEQRPQARTPPVASDDGTSVRALNGKVYNEDDQPVGGALVMVANLELGSEVATTTDSNGEFTLALAPRTDLVVEVRADSYDPVRLYVPADAADLDARLPRSAAPWPPLPATKKGLTWVKALHDNVKGQDQVSCHDYTVIGGPQSPTPTRSCDPYVGDTACNLARPILCVKQDGSGSNGHVWNFYNGWAAGHVGITHPIIGTTMTSLAVANSQCVAEFGAGWRMASHHDGGGGGGWQWRAYGNLNTLYAVQQPGHTLNHRFWVYILESAAGPSPWDPTNPNNPPTGRAPAGEIGAQLATAGNCWN